MPQQSFAVSPQRPQDFPLRSSSPARTPAPAPGQSPGRPASPAAASRHRLASRTAVVLHEARALAVGAVAGLRAPRLAVGQTGGPTSAAATALAPTLGEDLRLLLHDPDYRRQFIARAVSHTAQGMVNGPMTLLMSMSTLSAAQGLLVNSVINFAELMVHQVAGLWRAMFSDAARNGSQTEKSNAVTRPQLVSRILLAGLYEVGIAACLLGVLACRGARIFAGQRILLAVGLIRVMRIFCLTSQWASLDGLKGRIADPAAQEVVKRRWDISRTLELGVGHTLNQCSAIGCQLIPYAIGCTSLAPLMACMLGVSVAVSMAGKLSLAGYLDEARPALAPAPA